MNENYDENVLDSEYVEESGSADSETDSPVSREDVLQVMRKILEEESSEVEEESSDVDYTEILEDILTELENQSLARSSEIESQNVPITEKSLNDFTVSETLLCIIVIVFLVKGFLKLIDKFTPHI